MNVSQSTIFKRIHTQHFWAFASELYACARLRKPFLLVTRAVMPWPEDNRDKHRVGPKAMWILNQTQPSDGERSNWISNWIICIIYFFRAYTRFWHGVTAQLFVQLSPTSSIEVEWELEWPVETCARRPVPCVEPVSACFLETEGEKRFWRRSHFLICPSSSGQRGKPKRTNHKTLWNSFSHRL